MSEIDIEQLLELLTADAPAFEPVLVGASWSALCPSPEHADRHPSWSIVDDPGSDRHGSHYCQSCKFGGGPWELAAAIWGVELLEAGRRLGGAIGWRPSPVDRERQISSRVGRRREIPIPAGVIVPSHASTWPSRYLDYLQGRGVGARQARQWGIGYADQGPLAGRVWVPARDYRGRLLAWSAREALGRTSTSSGRSWPRYMESTRRVCGECGSPRFDREISQRHRCRCGASRLVLSHKTSVLLGLHRAVPIDDRVTIAEGTFSCLALERAGWPNVLGLLGSDVMGGRGISTRLHILAHYDGPFFVVTDPDSAGDRVAEALHVLDGLSGQRRDVIRVRLSQSPDDCAFDELRDERRKYVDRTTRLS